jgi:hypothetical protein
LILAVCAGLAAPSPLSAQTFVTQACQSSVPATADIRFDNPSHFAWYRRFWSGQCQGLAPFTCISGYPNWNAVVAQLTAQAPPADRSHVILRLCRLGHVLGLEWARDNAVRRIDTDDLRRLTTVLTGQGSLDERLQRVDAATKALLARPRAG